MDKEMLNTLVDLSKKPTTELALKIMELSSENLILEQELKKKKEAIKEAREKLKSYITFCENDSQGVHKICNMAIRKYKNIDKILSKGENK